MRKNQLVNVIYLVMLIATLAGVISLLMNAIDMFLYFPLAPGSIIVYRREFYDATRTVLMVAGIVALVGFFFSVLSRIFLKGSNFISLLLFLTAAILIICIFFLPLPASYYSETSEYYDPEKVSFYTLQLRQSVIAMLLQQALYFVMLGATKMIFKNYLKNNNEPNHVQKT